MSKPIHGFYRVLGGLFLTPCGIYLDGPDKERVEADPSKVTCQNCKRTHKHKTQQWTASWQRTSHGRQPS